MDRTVFVLSLGFGILALTAQQAFPQGLPNCAPRAIALRQLAERWGESRVSVMLARDRVVELFAAPQSGTWTLLGTTADGVSCIIASGTAFEATPLPVGAPT